MSDVFTARVLNLLLNRKNARVVPLAQVLVGSRSIPLLAVCNTRARRYLLRLQSDGTARVTIPRGGSADFARQFAERNAPWLERQLHKLAARPRVPAGWTFGSQLLFRGELVRIERNGGDSAQVATETIPLPVNPTDLRPHIERHLRLLAARELPPRLLDLAASHHLVVQRVAVRNQRSRWGSCSRRGNISLNWRLIQMPPFVSDYICLHELAHLREMNHSARFWREVERLCPDYPAAERWLKQNARLLRL